MEDVAALFLRLTAQRVVVTTISAEVLWVQVAERLMRLLGRGLAHELIVAVLDVRVSLASVAQLVLGMFLRGHTLLQLNRTCQVEVHRHVLLGVFAVQGERVR